VIPFPLAVQPPTDAIWFGLLRYYLFFGILAAVIVFAWMFHSIVTNRAAHKLKKYPNRVPTSISDKESEWGNWKTILLTLMVTGSVLAFVEYQTFASTDLLVPPKTTADPITIGVIGRQFDWLFIYPNGVQVAGNLTVPQNEEIILNITSIDVDHSFEIPALSVARDAIPGVYNTLWFVAPDVAVYSAVCKELCGVGHALMTAKVDVVSQQAYQTWYMNLRSGAGVNQTN
jgi:cytochrome c oxidase subunit II